MGERCREIQRCAKCANLMIAKSRVFSLDLPPLMKVHKCAKIVWTSREIPFFSLSLIPSPSTCRERHVKDIWMVFLIDIRFVVNVIVVVFSVFILVPEANRRHRYHHPRRHRRRRHRRRRHIRRSRRYHLGCLDAVVLVVVVVVVVVVLTVVVVVVIVRGSSERFCCVKLT